MMTSLSSAPFASASASSRACTNSVSRRVFTRSPFAGADASSADEYPTTPTDVLLEISLGLDRGSLSRVMDVPTAQLTSQYQLNPRDRSLYAWFESTGMMLTLVAVGAALIAILLQ